MPLVDEYSEWISKGDRFWQDGAFNVAAGTKYQVPVVFIMLIVSSADQIYRVPAKVSCSCFNHIIFSLIQNYSIQVKYILTFQSRSNTIFSLKPIYSKQIEYISFYLDRRRDLKREKSQCSGSSILTVPHGYLSDRKKEKIFKGDGWPIRDNRKSFLLSSPHLLSLPNINNCVTPYYSKGCLCRFFLSWSIRR